MLSFTGPLKLWRNEEGSSHFITVPEDLAGEIKAHSLLVRRGFGSVKVEASINGTSWRTSIFPTKAGGYFLPVKIGVVRSAGLADGDEILIELELL